MNVVEPVTTPSSVTMMFATGFESETVKLSTLTFDNSISTLFNWLRFRELTFTFLSSISSAELINEVRSPMGESLLLLFTFHVLAS